MYYYISTYFYYYGIAIRILDCFMRYKSTLLRIKKMLGINCGYHDDDNNDIYDDDNDKDVRATDE